MDPIIGGSLIMGGASLAGSLLGSGSSAQAIGYNKWLQKKTWQREDNAVQRRAADLKAAGFSPLLAAGASAQTSPAAHIGAQDMPDLGAAASAAVQTKMAMAKQNADISQTEAQTKLLMGQLDSVNKQNALLQQTLDWYRDHPGTAPNIPGLGTANLIERGVDLAVGYGDRLGTYIGQKIIDNHPVARYLSGKHASWRASKRVASESDYDPVHNRFTTFDK